MIRLADMSATTPTPPVAEPGTRRARRRRRRRPSVIGVIGEVLITVGVVALLYVGWQMWLGDVIYGAQRTAAAAELSEQWASEYGGADIKTAAPSASPTADAETVTAAPPVLAKPADAQRFAVLRVPRFGADYSFEIAGGISNERTLDPIGVGYYLDTQMPGELGNFAIAAHRLTKGGAFNYLDHLQLGDAIVIETPEGWFTYRFRSLEYVQPTQVQVLDPVPQVPDAVAGDAVITMISCSPRWTMDERIIAYGVFESFTPRSAGEPASLTEAVSS